MKMNLCNVMYLSDGSLCLLLQCQVWENTCQMTIDNKSIMTLQDSESLITFVKANMVKPVNFHSKKNSVICVPRDTLEYPIASINFKSYVGTVTHLVEVVPHLVHEAIIDRNFPKFWELPDLVTVAEPESLASIDKVGLGDSSQGSPGFPFSVMAGELEETEEVPTASDNGQPSVDTEATLEFTDLIVHKENFGTEQRKDPTLARA